MIQVPISVLKEKERKKFASKNQCRVMFERIFQDERVPTARISPLTSAMHFHSSKNPSQSNRRPQPAAGPSIRAAKFLKPQNRRSTKCIYASPHERSRCVLGDLNRASNQQVHSLEIEIHVTVYALLQRIELQTIRGKSLLSDESARSVAYDCEINGKS